MSGHRPGCFLARNGVYERGQMPLCSGPMQKAHLIREQVLRRHGLASEKWADGVWVWACEAHHRAFDTARTIRVPRNRIPGITETWATLFGLNWWLDREYGERSAA